MNHKSFWIVLVVAIASVCAVAGAAAQGGGDVQGVGDTAALAGDVNGIEALAVVITASRTSGVAPLMIHFEAACTSEEFHTRDFTWDFGDPASGNWGTNDKSRNTAKGAIAAHVFEQAGTYTVTATVEDDAGDTGSATVQVVVDDPDVVYAGTATTCVNPAGDSDFTGAPAGSRQISTDDLSAITQYATAGSRILFKRGGSWTTGGLSNWPENGGPVTIGAYGTGVSPDAFGIYANAPLITVTGQGGYFVDLGRKQDWRIMDVNLRDPTRRVQGAVGGAFLMQRMLFLRVRGEGFRAPMGWSHWVDPLGPQIDQMAIVSCDFSDAASNVAYVGSERLVILGTRFRNAHDSHVLRVWQAYKGVISHNQISGSSISSSTGRHALKLHGPNEEQIASTDWDHLSRRTEFTILSDNVFGTSGPWPIAIAPTDSYSEQRLSNIIFERNRYCGDCGTQSAQSVPLSVAFMVNASRVTVRNNVFDGSNYGKYFTGIWVWSVGISPDPTELWIYNNTIYKAGDPNGQPWEGILVDTGAQSVVVRNNIVSFPATSSGHTTIVDHGSGTIQSNNVLNGNVFFVDADNGSPLLRSFDLTEGSTDAVNAGYTLPSVFEDFAGRQRPVGGAYDIGAHEFTPELALRGTPANRAIHLNWLVNAAIPTTSTWHIVYYSQTATSALTETGFVSATRAYTLTNLENYVTYTVTLNAMLDSSPFLTDTVTVMPTDIFVYLPLVSKED